jgi:hypothetical protein
MMLLMEINDLTASLVAYLGIGLAIRFKQRAKPRWLFTSIGRSG